MANFSPSLSVDPSATKETNHCSALAFVSFLFFMWGLLTSLNDVLIPHLKAVYNLSYLQAMLVQFCFFGAYFIVAIPAGTLIKRIGYQRGVVSGLAIAAIGCAVFYPAATGGYNLFLLAFFILASGITILQVAANPYVTVLGPASSASSRLTLTQAFNSFGTAVAPALGGMLILSNAVLSQEKLAQLTALEQLAYEAGEAAVVQGPYLMLAAALLAMAILFACIRLPTVIESAQRTNGRESILSHRHLVLGAVAIFLYVGGEVAIGSFLINFMGEGQIAGLNAAAAAPYVSYYWGGSMIGRFIGFAVMRHTRPGAALAFNGACSVALILVAVVGSGATAMWAILAVGLFNSILFPTIFSMALHKLGPATGQGSGLLCMAIVGGAIVPFGQGWLADVLNVQLSFLLPAACYLYILYYGFKYRNLFN